MSLIILHCPHEETASLTIQNAPNEASDQAAWMWKLIWTFTGCKSQYENTPIQIYWEFYLQKLKNSR